jgi:transcriptional regulator with XRE-family HTH domain
MYRHRQIATKFLVAMGVALVVIGLIPWTLAGARLKAGLTQAQLAQKLGIRQNMVSDYERGRRTYSDAMADRLSKVLQVREEYLRYGSHQIPAADTLTRAADR